MDVGPRAESLAGEVGQVASSYAVLRQVLWTGRSAVLRTVRRADGRTPAGATRPWAVAGPALEYGIRALADAEWQIKMRCRLIEDTARLDALFGRFGITVAGGDALPLSSTAGRRRPVFGARRTRDISSSFFRSAACPARWPAGSGRGMAAARIRSCRLPCSATIEQRKQSDDPVCSLAKVEEMVAKTGAGGCFPVGGWNRSGTPSFDRQGKSPASHHTLTLRWRRKA